MNALATRPNLTASGSAVGQSSTVTWIEARFHRPGLGIIRVRHRDCAQLQEMMRYHAAAGSRLVSVEAFGRMVLDVNAFTTPREIADYMADSAPTGAPATADRVLAVCGE